MRGVVVAVVAAAAAAAAAQAARPPTPPPKVSGAGSAPPPAWVEFGSRSRWLAYSSYCWTASGKAACVDFIPPQLRRDLPAVAVRPGTVLRFRLAFRPISVKLVLLAPGPRRTWSLAAAASTSWRAVRAGTLLLETKGAGGSAGYALKVSLR